MNKSEQRTQSLVHLKLSNVYKEQVLLVGKFSDMQCLKPKLHFI